MDTGWKFYEEAKKRIAGGTQLLSKRPEMWLPGKWPCYYQKAKGCEVWDLDGKRYYDFCIMGVGANVLGYAFDEVDEAAKAAIDRGGMCTLNAPEEREVAEQLLELHPWADMVRYSKTGGEAMAIASRIARAHTGKDVVLVCGYHGWHDWYLAANLTKGDPLAEVHLQGLMPAGVPKGLAGTNLIFHYNRFDEFEALIAQNEGKIAAVIMEPVRNDFPEDDFLKKIREVTREKGIVLIFDEVSSGFRLCAGGSHLTLGVEPDLAVFAKAMTNGYPLSAIIGKGDVMSAAQDTFISSTFWTERVSLAAAAAAIECFKARRVAEHLIAVGTAVQEGWRQSAGRHGLKIHVGGIYPMSHFSFEYPQPLAYKTFFTQEMLKKGFLAGTMCYASLAHTEELVRLYLQACDEVFAEVKRLITAEGGVTGALEGAVCHSGFERLN